MKLSFEPIKNPLLSPSLQNRTGISYFSEFIPKAITLAFIAGVVIFFFMLIIGAIQWITSGGDKEALSKARGRITSGLIGIIILFSVYVIVSVIEQFFGINILTIDIGSLIIK